MAVQIPANRTDFFQNVRINRLVQRLAAETEVGANLTFLNRTPIVNATEDEIMGSFSGNIFAADLIMEDAEAVVYEGGQLTTNLSGGVPKMKIGARVSEGMMLALDTLAGQIDLAGQADLITGWENQLAGNLLTGVRQTMNRLCCDMLLNATSYDRFGVKLSTGFGAPASLVVTPAIDWFTNATGTANAAATPLADIAAIQDGAVPTLGAQRFNRITLSTLAWQALVGSTEFQTAVRAFLLLDPAQPLPAATAMNYQRIFTDMTGLQVELEDNVYTVRNANGQKSTQRYLPLNKVLLTNTADDNNQGSYYFANTIVPETISARYIAGAPDLGGVQFGPVSYYTGNIELNPPDLRAWAVGKGFPIRVNENCAAVLNIYVP